MNSKIWNVLATDGAGVKSHNVETAHPHYEAIRYLVDLPHASRNAIKGLIAISGADLVTVDSVAGAVDAFMSVDFASLAEQLSGQSAVRGSMGSFPVALFMAERTCKGTQRFAKMVENMPWLESFLPSDLAQLFPLVDDDGELASHIADLQTMADVVIGQAEGVLASPTVSAQERNTALLQLQMAAYMKLRPRNLLSILLSSTEPVGHIRNVLREFRHALLDLY